MVVKFNIYFVKPYSSTKQCLLIFLGLVLTSTRKVFNKQFYTSLPLSNSCVISLEDEVTVSRQAEIQVLASYGLNIVLLAFVSLVGQACACSKSPTRNSRLENFEVDWVTHGLTEGHFVLFHVSVRSVL